MVAWSVHEKKNRAIYIWIAVSNNDKINAFTHEQLSFLGYNSCLFLQAFLQGLNTSYDQQSGLFNSTAPLLFCVLATLVQSLLTHPQNCYALLHGVNDGFRAQRLKFLFSVLKQRLWLLQLKLCWFSKRTVSYRHIEVYASKKKHLSGIVRYITFVSESIISNLLTFNAWIPSIISTPLPGLPCDIHRTYKSRGGAWLVNEWVMHAQKCVPRK